MKRLLSLVILFAALVPLAAKARVINIPADFETIQAGINAASQVEIDTLLLGDGRFVGAGNVNVTIDRPLVLMSVNGAEATVLDAEGADASRCLIATVNVHIYGITFKGARISGLRIEGANDLLIERCIFQNNDGRDQSIAGAGLTIRSSIGAVKGCIFRQNTTISSAGGVVLNTNSNITFTDCIFDRNHAERFGGAALITNTSNGTFFNCIFDTNSAVLDGGAISYSRGSLGTISFCTIVGNTSDELGGGIYKGTDGHPRVFNCIIRGNAAQTGNQLCAQDNGGEITIDYCNVEGGNDEAGRWAGEHILTDDPLFTAGRDPDWGINGFFLDDDSPCVDAGSNQADSLGVDTLFTRTDRTDDSNVADLGYHYWIGDYRIAGRLYGQVLSSFDNDNPVEGAIVRTSRGQSAVTDQFGNWEISRAYATDFTVTATKVGFEPTFRNDLHLEEDGELEVILHLNRPNFELGQNDLQIALNSNDSDQVTLAISNTGNAPLRWTASTTLPDSARFGLLERRFSWDVNRITGDNSIYGVAFDGDNYYLSGPNGANPNKIYVVTREGELTSSFNQFGTAAAGMRDLAWDGENLWGTSGSWLIKFSPQGDSISAIRGPAAATTCITFDSERNRIWASSVAGDLVGYDLAGNRGGSIPHGNLRIYGLACMVDDPDGYDVYIHCNLAADARQLLYKADPATGAQTQVGVLTPPEGGTPEGAELTSLYDPYSQVLLAIANSQAGRRLEGWQISSHTDWMSLDPTAGEIAGGDRQELTLSVRAAGFPDGLYGGEIHIIQDAINAEPNLVIPFTMDVTEGPVHSERQIDLAFGWNLVSAPITPDEQDIPTLLRPLTDAGSLWFMKDFAGHFYHPGGEPFNNIGPWTAPQAYWLKMSAPARLTLAGVTVRPTDPIDLNEGWNGTSYYPRNAQETNRALGGLGDALLVAKDAHGNFYLPQYRFDGIGTFQPGQGYLIKTSRATQLVWGAGGRFASTPTIERLPARILQEVPVTGFDMSLLLLTDAEDCSEVGVYADDRLVGVGVVSQGRVGIAVRGDDPTTDHPEGAAEEAGLTIKLLSSSGSPLPASVILKRGELIYHTNSIAVAEMQSSPLPTTLELMEAYPNPFNGSTVLNYRLAEPGKVMLRIFDTQGRVAATLVESNQAAGGYSILWHAENAPTGLYFAQLEAAGESRTIKLVLTK